jgi:hypothetical protein
MNPQIAFEGYMPIDATRDQGIGLEFRGGVQAPNLVDGRMIGEPIAIQERFALAGSSSMSSMKTAGGGDGVERQGQT